MATVQSFRRSHKAANVFASVQSAGQTPCPEEAVQASAKTLRNSVEEGLYSEALLETCLPSLQEAAEPSWDGEARSQKRGAQ